MKRIILLLVLTLTYSCVDTKSDLKKENKKKIKYETKVDYSKKDKKLWAKSFLGKKAPKLIVEEWIGKKPSFENKFMLLDFWGTSCHQCKKLIPILNDFQKKYKDKLVIVGLSGDSKESIENFMKSYKFNYYKAIDRKSRTKRAYRVRGIPHVVIIDPNNIVVWEGFPFLSSDPLNESRLNKILNTK